MTKKKLIEMLEKSELPDNAEVIIYEEESNEYRRVNCYKHIKLRLVDRTTIGTGKPDTSIDCIVLD